MSFGEIGEGEAGGAFDEGGERAAKDGSSPRAFGSSSGRVRRNRWAFRSVEAGVWQTRKRRAALAWGLFMIRKFRRSLPGWQVMDRGLWRSGRFC